MAVWSVVEFLEVAKSWRFDAEYYRPQIIQYVEALRATGWKIKMLGDLVQDGYRVVYENTKILDEAFDPERHVKFLQAANIRNDFPIINEGGMGWVSRSDWERYPKGRIEVGEILVEVKGEAKKVVMVPAGLPAEVMVTGTLYKMQIDETQVDRRFILVYLLSELGRQFRDRAKTNTLISYVAKSELYSIPIPIPPDDIQQNIGNTYNQAFTKYQESQALYAQAEALLLHELGLDTLDLSHQTTFTATFAEVMEARRLDAEYFHPEKQHFLEQLNKLPGDTVSHYFTSVSDIFVPPSRDNGVYLSNYDLTDALNFFLAPTDPVLSYTMGSNKKKIRRGDVVISRLRSYLREIALVNVPDQEECVGSTEFIVLRPRDTSVTPELLLMYLRSEPVQKILKWCQDGSNHPRFQEKEVLNLRLPNRILAIQNEIQSLVQSGIASYFEASRLLEQAKQRVEELILERN